MDKSTVKRLATQVGGHYCEVPLMPYWAFYPEELLHFADCIEAHTKGVFSSEKAGLERELERCRSTIVIVQSKE